MRAAQKALAGFTPLLDWTRFRRKNLNGEIEITHPGCTAFACGDAGQAVAWVLRRDRLDRSGRVRRDAEPVSPELRLPGLAAGRYRVTFWNTEEGRCAGCTEVERSADGTLRLLLPPLSLWRSELPCHRQQPYMGGRDILCADKFLSFSGSWSYGDLQKPAPDVRQRGLPLGGAQECRTRSRSPLWRRGWEV
jgi:hypothetical protein